MVFVPNSKFKNRTVNNYVVIEEIIVDAIRCQCDLSDKASLLNIMKQAAVSVGARILESHCTQYEPYGATFVLLLAESHILLSTWPEYDYATMNIFLCNKDMSTTQIRDQLLNHLRPVAHKEYLFHHVINNPQSCIDKCRIFLAAPFTQQICKATGCVPPEKRISIQTIAKILRAYGAKVFLSHEREAWGHALMDADDCSISDFRELQSSDVIVAVLNPPSYGVCVELGWASALQLPIILLDELREGVFCTPLVQGLHSITRCYVANSIDEVLKLLSDIGNIDQKQGRVIGN